MEFNQSVLIIVNVLYYLLVGFFLFFSLFTVYILLRYGKSKAISLITSLAYSLFFLIVLAVSFAHLQALSRATNG